MPEKISILKESGETVSSNVVSIFMVPDTQKKYLISTENTVDPHGLTVLHVSEIVDGVLQKVATDEEWSSIKTIMRAIISGNVGSYQYLQTVESIKSVDQYSRDISVSASAAKQMTDNYAARDVNSIASALDVVAPPEPVEEIEEVAPGIGVVDNSVPSPVVESTQEVAEVPVPTEPAPVAEPVPAEPTPVAETAPVTESVPVEPAPVATVPAEPVVDPQPQVVETTVPVEETVTPIEEVVPAVAEATPVTEEASVDEETTASVVVEPHLVASSPVTLPVSEPAVQTVPEPVTFVSQADLYAAPPVTQVPVGQISNNNSVIPSLGIKFDINPSFSPDASLDDVVLASQEMFIEGTRNLVQTIQEKVYRDMYSKEADLKAKEDMLNQREEALNQREKMLNEQMMAMMSNFASMQAKNTVQPPVQQPTKVEVDSDKK